MNPCRLFLRLALLGALATQPLAHAQDALALKARYAALHDALADNVYQRPLYLESSSADGAASGDIYARIDQPYAVVGPALDGMNHWCDILILHLNVRSCSAGAGATLNVAVGRKFDQPEAEAYPFAFAYHVAASTPEYLQVVLGAAHGPLGTSRYRIVLETVAVDAGRSFVHLSYSYAYGIAARMAVQAYGTTIGRDKVGFTVVGHDHSGQPVYVDSMRGIVERNAMRYYLAIESYLGALGAPPARRSDKSLSDWYAAVERYPRQLHELDRGDYLNMKRRDLGRQHVAAAQ